MSLVSRWDAGIIAPLAECHLMRQHQECLSIIGNPIMKLKLVVAICALVAMPAFAQAKHGDTPPTAPRPAMAQVQKVIQIISGNKTKLQQYCEIAKLDPQIAEAEQKHDANRLEVLLKRADDWRKKIARNTSRCWKGLPGLTRIPVKASRSLLRSIRSINFADRKDAILRSAKGRD